MKFLIFIGSLGVYRFHILNSQSAAFRTFSPLQNPKKCAAVVVGAGPAGVAVLGNLLDLGLNNVAWVDPHFNAGRVNRKYRVVPRYGMPLKEGMKQWPNLRRQTDKMMSSNTKTSLFYSFATALESFRNVVQNTPTPNPFSAITELKQDDTCSLHYATDMIQALSDGLVKADQVVECRATVTSADLDEKVSNLIDQ